MALDDLGLDAHHMHDREDAGLAEIAHFLALVVGEEPADALVPGGEGLDHARMEDGVELALGQHGLDRFVMRQARDLHVGRRREVDVLVELGEPMDRFVRHAVFVLEDAAQPMDGGHEKRFDADLAPDQVLRLAMPFSVLMKTKPWRKRRWRKTGSARNGKSWSRETM